MKSNVVGWMKRVIALSLAIVPLLANSQGNENANQILDAYKAAHSKKDVSGLMALVLFQSGGEAEKTSWRNDFEAETRSAVILKVVPISAYSAMLSPEALKRIRPTIKLVNWLVVEYPPEDKSIQRSGLYPIGIESGRAFIVGP
jgi:hypothetical protein